MLLLVRSEEWSQQPVWWQFLKQNLLYQMEIMKKIISSLLWNWLISYCCQFLLKLKLLNVFSKLIKPINIFKTNPYYHSHSPFPMAPPSATVPLRKLQLSPVADTQLLLPPNQRGLLKTLESSNSWERIEKREVHKVCLVDRERRKARNSEA